MVTRFKPKTRQQAIEERGQQIGWQYEMAARREAEQAIRDEAHAAFARRVQAGHAGVASAIARAEAALPAELNEAQRQQALAEAQSDALAEARASLVGLDVLFAEDTARRMAEAEEAERAALAARTPREIVLSQLDPARRGYIAKWEALNHVEWRFDLPQ